jgi:hypothetical protein
MLLKHPYAIPMILTNTQYPQNIERSIEERQHVVFIDLKKKPPYYLCLAAEVTSFLVSGYC